MQTPQRLHIQKTPANSENTFIDYTTRALQMPKHMQIQKNTCKFRKKHANSENTCIDFITRANRETNCKLWQRKCVPGDHNQWRTHIRLAVLFNYEGVKSFDCATRGTCFSFIMILKWFCVFSTMTKYVFNIFSHCPHNVLDSIRQIIVKRSSNVVSWKLAG